jgi:hypothetical protein
MTSRRQNIQTISWFWDIYQRERLNLDPSYQRRSVWNQAFKDYFIETVLLGFPTPAIFLYEEISPEGRAIYNVVDGKQRLSTIFEFINGEFPVSDESVLNNLQGSYFKNLDDETKKEFWNYQFIIEFLPETDENVIRGIFDRINKNVAKLTPQELRHARFDGEFITVAEQLTEVMEETLPRGVPRFGVQSKKQMKDVEMVAILLLFIEEGARSSSQSDLDKAFSDRDQVWEQRIAVEKMWRSTIEIMGEIYRQNDGNDLSATRLRNQADFYSLFGALVELQREGKHPKISEMINRLPIFVAKVEDPTVRVADSEVAAYYDAARSASSDKGPREMRIRIMKGVLLGEI